MPDRTSTVGERFAAPTLAARGAASGRRTGRYRASGRPAAPAFTLSLISLLFPSWGCSAPDAGRTAPVPRAERSVVLVTLDTVRADRLEPYGARDAETPTLAALGAEGVVFEHAFAAAPVTLPAHATLLTGLHPPQHGVRHNGIHRLGAEATTLAERLAERGYRSAAFVSAAVLERRFGLDQGFDLYDADLSRGRPRAPRAVAERPAGATVDAALAWLEGLPEDERPLFLWVHLYDPHADYEPPEPYATRFRDRPYDGEIAYADAELARLLDHPRLAPERAVALVVGDHGESLGEHGEPTHAMLVYDATLRIPWIVRLPEGPRGLRIAGPAAQVDLVPTVLDLLGLPVPEELPGESQVPAMEGAAPGSEPAPEGPALAGEPALEGPAGGGPPPARERHLYAESRVAHYVYGWAKLASLRRGDLKYVEAPEPELYDVARDPGELTNLAERRPGDALRLARELERFLAAAGGGEAESAAPLDAATAEKLRSLGYLAGAGGAGRADPPDPKVMMDVHVTLERAGELLARRHLPEAVRAYRQALARDPQNLQALGDLAAALGELGRLDDADRALDRALELAPERADLHLARAGLERRRGRPAAALAEADLALSLDPDSLDAVLERADLLARLGRGDEAAAELAAALERWGDHPRAAIRYADLVELPAGDLGSAEARLRRALDREPWSGEGWRALGETLRRAGRPEEALAAYREGLGRQPRDASLRTRLARLLAALGRPADAERELRAGLAELGGDPAPTGDGAGRRAAGGAGGDAPGGAARDELEVALGEVLAARGRRGEAERAWAAVLARDPGNREARNSRAAARAAAGDLAAARPELARLTAGHPRWAEAWANRAAAAVAARDWPDAETAAARAVELDTALAGAWNSLGIAREERGRPAEALESYERAADADRSYWQATYNAGLLLRRLGRPAEAAGAFRRVLDRAPRHARSHYELGLLYAGPLADPPAAARHLRAALAAEPAHPRAAEIRRLLADLPTAAG